jgi:cytidylate kinase
MIEVDGPKIFESRLAGWWAKEMSPSCSRIWIHVDDEVRASRVAEREGISIEEALKANFDRSVADSKRFMKMYGIDIGSKSPYTHEIDATRLSKEQVLMEVLGHLEVAK